MKDAYYFSHDSNARHDPNIKYMMLEYGWKGYGWYWAIIEILRDQDNYKYPLNRLCVLIAEFGDGINVFIEKCINDFALFYADEKYFWSNSLLKRMKKRERISMMRKEIGKRGGEAKGKQLLSKGVALKERKVKERKVKEMKVKESKVDLEDAQQILDYYKTLTGKIKVTKIPHELTARLKEGATVEDCKKIILYKYKKWWSDEKTRTWVNLTTLFRPSHFEEYLSQAEDELDNILHKDYEEHCRELRSTYTGDRTRFVAPTFEEFKREH